MSNRQRLVACAAAVVVAFGCENGSVPGPATGPPGAGESSNPSANTTSGPTSLCPACKHEQVGSGTGAGFEPQSADSKGVGLDDEGALIVDPTRSSGAGKDYLWVADTNLPGVVKIDLETMQLVARYQTGGGSTSRTTVNVLGEAFVGARKSGKNGNPGVTKVLPFGANCPDTNQDGQITTSSGPDDVLPFGQDDCVAWHTETEGDIRGLAAQDFPGSQTGDTCAEYRRPEDEDFLPSAGETPSQHALWIGGLHGKLYKLDAETGEILINVPAPSGIYGMALSGDGRLWTSRELAFVDTKQCTDQASCAAAPICRTSCSETTCPATCDGAAKAKISGISGYGITVDAKQRVWLSQGPTKRYDPGALPDQRLTTGAASGSGGIAADGQGWVWAANGAQTVRLDAETLQSTLVAAPNKGLVVDRRGRVITIRDKGVHLIEPGKLLDDLTLSLDVAQLKGFAYAYSDMTGVQTQLASNHPGWYRRPFDGCASGKTTWSELTWDVQVPERTSVVFHVRSAATRAELAQASWRLVVCIGAPGGQGSKTIGTQQGAFVEVEARLTMATDADGTVHSSRVKNFGVSFACENQIL